MIPVISVVGRSNTGKTTLIEKLVKELSGRGWRIATIKHDVHGFDIDKEGKDSYRHKAAGARMTVISSPAKVALVKDVDRDMEIDEIASGFISDADLIITEGYKRNTKDKIEVYRKEAYPDLLCGRDDRLMAVATDAKLGIDVPQYDINDAQGLGDLIEEKFLKGEVHGGISLEVDGKIIPLKPFISKMLQGSIRGLISSLKNCEDPGVIRIKISGSAGK